MADQTKVHRQQISCAIEADAENKAEAAPGHEIAVAECGEIDQRRRMAQGAPDHAAATNNAKTRQQQCFDAGPAAVRGLLENQLQAAEKDREQWQGE